MNDKKFEWWVDWLFVSTFDTKYWEIIKLWLNVETLIKFMKENQNEKWFVNVDIMTAKSWKKYAKLNTWKWKQEEKDILDDWWDIPF